MNILLLNPPFLNEFGTFSRSQRSPAITKSGTLYYPMWLSYACGVLEKAGHNCMLIDSIAENMDFSALLKKIGSYNPGLIITSTSTPSIYNDIELTVRLKIKYSSYTILVGTHPSALPKETLKINKFIDAIAHEEFENTVLEIANRIDIKSIDYSILNDIKGLTYRKKSEIITTNPRPINKDLDNYPFVSSVYKKHLNYKNYFYSHSKCPIVVTVTSRGCPHKCIYCQFPQTFSGRTPRYRSINNVVDEIEYILKNYKDVKEIMFEDDTFTLNKKRCIDFAKEIIKRKIKVDWSANSRCQVDKETLKWLKESGARLFCVGVESGSQKILDNLKKNLKIEEIIQFFDDCKEVGIKIHGCFLFGAPGETRETMLETLNLAIKLNPDTAQFFPLIVYPGTEAYKWAKEKNYLKSENFRLWLTPDGRHNTVISRPDLSDKELVEFCDYCRKKFYLRSSYMASKFIEACKEPAEFKRLFVGFKNLFFKNMIK